MREVPSGEATERSYEVTADMTADAHGNPGVDVLATPVVVELIEATAIAALSPHLDDGEMSVGVDVKIRHVAPTPVGQKVTVSVTTGEQRGSSVSFDVAVSDAQGEVASGTHRRAAVERDAFLAQAAART